jgi:hypothetical protein
MGKCSHCGVHGHTYLKCTQLTHEQIKEIKKKKKEEKEAVSQRRVHRQQRNVVHNLPLVGVAPAPLPPDPSADLQFQIVNMTDHELVCYYKIDQVNLKRFVYVPSHSSKPIKCKKDTQISIFPVIELVVENGIDTRQYVTVENEFTTFFNKVMADFDGDTIIIDIEYNPPKSELEEWKELGLKSHFLLKQIRDMTSQKKGDEFIVNEKYENIEVFIEMIQAIVIPNTCTEADKEKAGIPSALTNIT